MTFDNCETAEADVFFNEGRPIFADSMERDFMEAWNRNTPPGSHKLIKVKIFRTGSVTMTEEMKRELSPFGMHPANHKRL